MPEALSKKMIVHITPKMHERVKRAAQLEDVSMAEFIRTSVAQRLDVKSASVTAGIIKEVKEISREY